MQKIGPQGLYVTLTGEETFESPPRVRTLCSNYEDCLEHAAGRFRVSFTCKGCYMALAGAETARRRSPLDAPEERDCD